MKCLHNVRHQFFLIFKIVSGTHGTKNFPIYNDLRANIICRFQKNRIHQDRWFYTCRFCLHNLCSAHFKALTGYKRVQCHILRFEWCHTVSILMKYPAKSGSKKTLSCIGHGSLYHDRLCHICSLSYQTYACSSCFSTSACATAAFVVPSRIARINS